jgi:hypothetical protein
MCGVRFFLVCQSSILATSSLAQQVLVAVDLPDRESIKRWHSLDHSTFAYFENSAIEQVDESDLPILAHERFALYFLVDRTLGRKLVLIR